MNPQWLRQPVAGRRLPFRWCIFSALLIIFLTSWFVTRESERMLVPVSEGEGEAAPELETVSVSVSMPEPEPEPPKSEFEACPYLITEADMPPLEELLKQKDVETSLTQNQGALVISAKELMELVESGEHPAPRILHQSWKDGPLPEHFERWSMAWRNQLGKTWLYVAISILS
jgi:hypothetical protein